MNFYTMPKALEIRWQFLNLENYFTVFSISQAGNLKFFYQPNVLLNRNSCSSSYPQTHHTVENDLELDHANTYGVLGL